MAVVKNLLVRAGADFSAMRREMQRTSRETSKFSRETNRSLNRVSGREGFGGFANRIESLSRSMPGGLSQITAGLGRMSAAAATLSGRLGVAGAAIGAFTATLALATAGIARASQPAVKFQADLDRLNMSLGDSSKAYLDWAKAQGIAKTTAAELGATYGVLLSSFIKDTQQLGQTTQELVQATRVVASATGRSIEDTFERIRSGLLGNTEAIEDLGIFVNVAMIESTDAFRRFAGDKSWDQLDFRIQQQIRLHAILEQAQARYGNTLQNNVMTRQNQLIEQWKNIKLHLSQAFLPLWNAVLPGLIRLAEAISNVTERIAIFMHQLFGMKYEATAVTQSTNQQTDALDDLGDAYEDVGKKAKKASRGVAAFDEVNQLNWGDGGDGSGGSGGGSGGAGGGLAPGSKTTTSIIGKDWDGLVAGLPKLQLQFDPPSPPDAGIGAVATAVTETVNQLVMNIKSRMSEMWQNIGEQSLLGRSIQEEVWRQLAGNVGGVTVPGLTGSIIGQWGQMVGQLNQQTENGRVGIENKWNVLWSNLDTQNAAQSAMTALRWSSMMGQLNATTAAGSMNLQSQWSNMWANLGAQNQAGKTSTESLWASMIGQLALLTVNGINDLQTKGQEFWTWATNKTRESWNDIKQTWTDSITQLKTLTANGKQALTTTWNELLTNLRTGISGAKTAVTTTWQQMLEGMQGQLAAYLPGFLLGWGMIASGVESLIDPLKNVRSAWSTALSDMLSEIQSKTSSILSHINSVISAWASMQSAISGRTITPNTVSAPTTSTGRSPVIDNMPIIGDIYKGLDKIRDLTAPIAKQLEPIMAAGPGGIAGAVAGGVKYGGTAAANAVTKAAQGLADLLKNIGITVPAFAAGGITHGPMLALVGDNPGGQEVISPLDDLVDIVQSAVASALVAAQSTQRQGDIVIQVDGATLARVTKPYFDAETDRIGPAIITTTR